MYEDLVNESYRTWGGRFRVSLHKVSKNGGGYGWLSQEGTKYPWQGVFVSWGKIRQSRKSFARHVDSKEVRKNRTSISAMRVSVILLHKADERELGKVRVLKGVTQGRMMKPSEVRELFTWLQSQDEHALDNVRVRISFDLLPPAPFLPHTDLLPYWGRIVASLTEGGHLTFKSLEQVDTDTQFPKVNSSRVNGCFHYV